VRGLTPARGLLVDDEVGLGTQAQHLGGPHQVLVLVVEELEAVEVAGEGRGRARVNSRYFEILFGWSPKPSTFTTSAMPGSRLSPCSDRIMSRVKRCTTSSFCGRWFSRTMPARERDTSFTVAPSVGRISWAGGDG